MIGDWVYTGLKFGPKMKIPADEEPRMLCARSCLIAGAVMSLTGLSQAQEARLSGAVTDPTGAVLPGVIITATQTQQNISASTKSDAAGLYRFPRLSPGAYEVKAEFNGFKTFVQSGLALT